MVKPVIHIRENDAQFVLVLQLLFSVEQIICKAVQI